MGRCPKCKSRVAVEDTKCRKCGALLGVPDASGTLNAEQHFQLSKDADSVPMPNDASKTVTDVDASGDASGTLGIGDLPKDSPSGTLSESINQVSDSSKTLRLDAGDEILKRSAFPRDVHSRAHKSSKLVILEEHS